MRALTPEQQDLATRYLPLANSVAGRYARAFPQLADEFRGEAVLMICLAARDFDAAVSPAFPAYARVRVAGACRDVLRRCRRWARPCESSLDEIEEARLLLVAPAEVPGAASEAVEEARRLIRRAPKVYVPYLEAAFVRGLKQRDIARELGRSKQRVSAAIQDGLEHLARVTPCPR